MKLLRVFLKSMVWILICIGDSSAQTPSQATNAQELVKLNVILLDENGGAVGDIRPTEIEILVDNKPQKISLFERDTSPINYVLVIDHSGSLKPQFSMIKISAKALIESNQPLDETMLVSFVASDNIGTLLAFSSDKTRLTKEIDDLLINGGESAVVDALYVTAQAAIARVRDNKLSRSAVVILSDGEDRESFYTEDKLLKLLRGSRVQVYTVGLVREVDDETGFSGRSDREKAVTLFTKVAEESGGRSFIVKEKSQLEQAVSNIISSLRTQYIVGFSPAKVGKPNAYRKVKIRLAESTTHKKYKVIAPAGYITTM